MCLEAQDNEDALIFYANRFGAGVDFNQFNSIAHFALGEHVRFERLAMLHQIERDRFDRWKKYYSAQLEVWRRLPCLISSWRRDDGNYWRRLKPERVPFCNDVVSGGTFIARKRA